MIYSVIFDWKRTLYDPDNKLLIKDGLKILKFLKRKNVPLILIGKGGNNMLNEVDRLGIKDYFSDIVFCKERKDNRLFESYISNTNPKATLIIGDRVRSELEIGNILNATTIWIRQGKFATEKPLIKNQTPTYTVNSLYELLTLLKNNFFKPKA